MEDVVEAIIQELGPDPEETAARAALTFTVTYSSRDGLAHTRGPFDLDRANQVAEAFRRRGFTAVVNA